MKRARHAAGKGFLHIGSGLYRERESPRKSEWERRRVGEGEKERQGEWERGRVGDMLLLFYS
jgi:hypothetical protein